MPHDHAHDTAHCTHCSQDTVMRWASRPPAGAANWDEYVLVVEPDPAIRELARCALRSVGRAVIAVAREAEALRLVKAQTPAVVVLDVPPAERDGSALWRALHATRRAAGVPIVLITDSNRDTAPPGGRAYVLRKPVPPMHLAAVVNDAIRRSNGRAG